MRPRPGSTRRSATVAVGTLLLLPLCGSVASAHVAVSSTDATRGGEVGLISFRVPTESATASTVKVTIALPADALFATVSTEPTPGWTVTTTTRKLAAPTKVGDFTLTQVTSTVTWAAATGTGIRPNQFQLFRLLVGPLPDQAQLAFKAVQTYSDSSVVTWDEPTPVGGAEPEHPAPVLTLLAPDAVLATAPSTTAPPETGSPGAAPAVPSAGEGTKDGSARVLAGLGIALAAAALVAARTGRRRHA
jgi:uncharacterized protein YcnI